MSDTDSLNKDNYDQDSLGIGSNGGQGSNVDNEKNRGNYRCSRCNLPKKGHICPYQPRFRKKHIECTDAETQVELDPHKTVAALGDLTQQGAPASYDLQAF